LARFTKQLLSVTFPNLAAGKTAARLAFKKVLQGMMQKVLRLSLVVGCVLMSGIVLSSLSEAGEPSLKVAAGAKGFATIELINEVPVLAVQFELTGVKITQVRTTDRAKGFLTKFNEQNGKVVLLSTAAERIPPGKGTVLEIACDKPEAAVLTGVRIVGDR
jgi:hypothetical protein